MTAKYLSVSLWTIFILCFLCVKIDAQLSFEGQYLTVATGQPNLATILRERAAMWRNITGATVIVQTRDFGSFFDDVKTDLLQSSPFFDALNANDPRRGLLLMSPVVREPSETPCRFVFAPQWLADLADCKTCGEQTVLLQPLSDYVKADPNIEWLDVSSFFRQFSAVYDGQIYGIPLDGDVHYLHVRKDVLDSRGIPLPETWEDLLEAARQVHGLDMNNDTIPDFGTCISRKKGSLGYWWPIDVYAPYIQALGTAEGVFFDLDSFEPLVLNDGFSKALDIFKRLMQYGSPDELDIDVQTTRTMFSQGRCAFTFDWADPFGFMGLSPFASGYVLQPMPGSYEVVDRSTGRLRNCTTTICPTATVGRRGNLINRAPYAAFGGWSGGISKFIPQAKKDLAYQFFSYLSRPSSSGVDVTKGLGFDPYRLSHLNATNWLNAGFSQAYLDRNINNFRAALSSPNLVIDLRVPGNNVYQAQILDGLLFDYLTGNLTLTAMRDRLFAGWEAQTNLLGRGSQLATYRATIGAPRIFECSSIHYNYSVSSCETQDEVSVSYAWVEPKVCRGGLSLPSNFIRSRCPYVRASSPVAIGLTVAAAIIIGALFIMGILLFAKRRADSIRKSSWVFSLIILAGGAMMNTFVLASVGKPDRGTCIINIWLLSLGYVLLFGGFLAKMWRIERLLNAPLGLKIIRITDVDLAKMLGALIVVDVALLSTWTWLRPGPGAVMATSSLNGVVSSQLECAGGQTVGIALLFVYKALMLLYGGFLSFRTRNAPGEFSEQRFTTTAIIVVAFASVVIIPLIYTIESNKVLIASLGVMFSTLVSVGIYTVPKLLQAYDVASFGFSSAPSSTTMSHYHPSKPISSVSGNSSLAPQTVSCPECGCKFEI